MCSEGSTSQDCRACECTSTMTSGFGSSGGLGSDVGGDEQVEGGVRVRNGSKGGGVEGRGCWGRGMADGWGWY